MKCATCNGTGRVYSAGAPGGPRATQGKGGSFLAPKILCPNCRGSGHVRGGR